MARFTLLLFAALIALTASNSKDTGVLVGRVVDESGKPVIAATVQLEGTRIGALTKAPDGRFAIVGIRTGSYTAKIAGLGFVPVTKKVEILAGDTTDLGIVALAAREITGDEITVRARRDTEVERENVTTTRSITTEPASGGARRKSVHAVTPQGPTNAQGHSGVAIRGGRQAETKGNVDGIEVSDPFAGGFGASPIDFSAPGEESALAPDGTVIVRPDDISGENYAKIYENPFLASHVSPLSTFSIDVDRASYSNMRRFINASMRPPADAVRIEELVNYFEYDYADPADEHPFRIATELSDCPWDRTHRLVRVGLQGRRMKEDVLPPSNLTFLIDVSGSMSSADKLPLLRDGFKLLVERLRPQDNVAIVVYAGAAGVVLPMTPGSDKTKISEAIDRLAAGGSTAGGAGIELAYRIARENRLENGNNRVILATDGDFNVGVSSEAELVSLIEERRKDGVFLTVLGFGTGNYQDAKMEQLADKGNGNYAYIDNLDEARKVFVHELSSTLVTIAKDVKIQVVFSPERVESYRLIGYENRMLATEDFDNDLKDAGELGAGHSVTALYEIVPRGSSSADLDGWLGRPDTLDMPEDWQQGEMMRVRLRYKLPDSDISTLVEGPVIERGVGIERASEDFRFAAAVAEFGLLLRDSRHKGSASFDEVLRLANTSKSFDPNGYRAEFVSLVERARGMVTASR